MPPRYAYWTILVDEQPTAFRAGSQEDLMPTFKRLKAKHPSATMMWFQNGKLWPSRVDAQEAMHARGEMGRRGDERQGGFRDRGDKPFSSRRDQPVFARGDKPAFTPRREPSEKLDWKAKGDFVPAPKRERTLEPKGASFERERKPRQTSSSASNLEWKAKGDFIPAPKQPKGSDRDRKPAWGSNASSQARKASYSDKPDWKSRGSNAGAAKREWTPKSGWTSKRPAAADRPGRSERPEWKPKASTQESEPRTSEKRKWVPKEEYKKSMGLEARRDKNWRPGGAHKDPRQKYKDAKKAKWTKFKKAIRTRSEGKKNKDS